MRQKCKNCIRFAESLTHVWYNRFTGEQHRDHFNHYCTVKHATIDEKRINQYNKCPYYDIRSFKKTKEEVYIEALKKLFKLDIGDKK